MSRVWPVLFVLAVLSASWMAAELAVGLIMVFLFGLGLLITRGPADIDQFGRATLRRDLDRLDAQEQASKTKEGRRREAAEERERREQRIEAEVIGMPPPYWEHFHLKEWGEVAPKPRACRWTAYRAYRAGSPSFAISVLEPLLQRQPTWTLVDDDPASILYQWYMGAIDSALYHCESGDPEMGLIMLERLPNGVAKRGNEVGRYLLGVRALCATHLGMSSRARQDRKRLYALSPRDSLLPILDQVISDWGQLAVAAGSPGDLLKLPWEQFEDLCGRMFEAEGASVVRTQATGDGGVDLIVTDQSGKMGVQCKRHSARIGVVPLRGLVGALGPLGLDRAGFITTSSFTSGAETFAANSKMLILDGPALASRLKAAGLMRHASNHPRARFVAPDLEGFWLRLQAAQRLTLEESCPTRRRSSPTRADSPTRRAGPDKSAPTPRSQTRFHVNNVRVGPGGVAHMDVVDGGEPRARKELYAEILMLGLATSPERLDVMFEGIIPTGYSSGLASFLASSAHHAGYTADLKKSDGRHYVQLKRR